MKRMLVGLILGFILVPAIGHADPAQDEKRDEKVVGLARVVCAQAGIVLHCGKLYTLDDRLSEGLARTARQTLDRALGPQPAANLISDESDRVSREIADVGEDQWCADQRDILNADGAKVFVD
ncbi:MULTISPECIES: hypothetical protein [Methylobacterium]|uniref:Secreted protein n=1 Tax=Methylobacterium thuringiense TaxID=1003091 RepID=A0ABQ4TL79_9HYPH|nr:MULTISPECIES: hypothetical protein [Methylobacterium]TXN21776.1 hypothetical protein FV217_13280 [Methylobacterium sp. WL9]GJE54817.1 hypothetical protein EKPJFOCH_1302 [Methylobacterium thuringiense]